MSITDYLALSPYWKNWIAFSHDAEVRAEAQRAKEQKQG